MGILAGAYAPPTPPHTHQSYTAKASAPQDPPLEAVQHSHHPRAAGPHGRSQPLTATSRATTVQDSRNRTKCLMRSWRQMSELSVFPGDSLYKVSRYTHFILLPSINLHSTFNLKLISSPKLLIQPGMRWLWIFPSSPPRSELVITLH